VQWLDAMHQLAGAHIAVVRERWGTRPSAPTVHDLVDEIVAVDRTAAPPDPVRGAADAARAAIANAAQWRRLIAALGVGPREVEWLALLAACELNPQLTRVLGYLDDSTTPAPPSPALAAQLWHWPLGYQPGPTAELARWQVAAPDGDWHATTPWTVDADVAAYLAGDDAWPDMRRDAVLVDVADRLCLHPNLLTEMRSVAARVDALGCEIELIGRDGSGRRTLLAQLAAALGHNAALITPGTGMRGLRAARLLEAVPLWVSGAGELIGVDATPGAITLVARETAAVTQPDGVVRLSWTIPPIRAEQRIGLWRTTTGEPAPPIVTDWDLSPADVLIGAAAAATGPAVTSRVVRERLRHGTFESMSPLALPYDWPDLVVPAQVSAQLHRLRNQVLLRREVLDEWEFRRLSPTTAGVTALFAGPSGTGKTMAAQVLARSLELDLFRIDLATVVSKYIGDTEKHLAAVFDEAERSNVVIFFDEADALFGQRTRVQDAHDRYANIEIDYLLQRLDTFRGVAILATNRKSDLDPAFLRRLRTIVDFVAPAEAERLRLWQLALPSHTSTGEQITGVLDHEWLAAHLELTGAEIKAIALSAAFDAREAGGLITSQTVLEASRRELRKRGAVLRLEQPVAVGQ
jgi:hypothetical protein